MHSSNVWRNDWRILPAPRLSNLPSRFSQQIECIQVSISTEHYSLVTGWRIPVEERGGCIKILSQRDTGGKDRRSVGRDELPQTAHKAERFAVRASRFKLLAEH